ncbi:hypothetical protein QT711_00100 [Sporosarcina saromensis]|uniref:Uncharacterized protein n=1 Tax=Sporosarcina saromensis TaxID=359365 RepID=A0ABU4G5E9_9BACL|nr:hypothetical protein [Sporosarcina saromensis]MDW0111563.1 hypothetical protein [Sporosarcina saromensis]
MPFLLVTLLLITFGLFVDWRRKRYRKFHHDANNVRDQSEVKLDYKMEGDRNSPSGYL